MGPLVTAMSARPFAVRTAARSSANPHQSLRPGIFATGVLLTNSAALQYEVSKPSSVRSRTSARQQASTPPGPSSGALPTTVAVRCAIRYLVRQLSREMGLELLNSEG